MRERKAFKRAIAFLMSALMAFSVLASDFSMVSAYAVDITEPVVNDSLDDDFTVTEEEIAAINEMGGDFGVMMLGVGRGEDQGKKPEPPKNTLTITVTAEGAAVTGATVSLYYEQVKQQPPHAHNNGNNTVERKYATVTEVGNGVYTADLGPGSHSWQYEISKSGYDIVSGTVGTDKEISVALQKDCKTDIVFKYYSSVDDEVAVGTKNAIKYTFADENFNIISGDFEDITYSGTVMNAEDFAKTFGSVTIPGYTYDKLFFYFEGSSALNSDTYASSFKNTGYQVNASYPSYIGWASPSYPNANDYGDGENSGYMAYDPTGTLRVVFKKNEYKVSFDLSTNDPSATLGENVSSEKTVKYSESYGELPTPTRTGYEFAGWVTEDGTKVTKDSKYELTSNQTLYADWSVSTTNVAYHSNHYGEKSGDDVVKTETAVVGSAIDFTPAIKAAGARYKYAFKGWSATRLDPDRTNPDEDILVTEVPAIEGDTLDLYAVFTRELITYNVKFNVGEGTIANVINDATYANGVYTTTAKYDDKIKAPGEPALDNYRFVGWKWSRDGKTYTTEEVSNLPASNSSNHLADKLEFTAVYSKTTLSVAAENIDATLQWDDTTNDFVVRTLNVVTKDKTDDSVVAATIEYYKDADLTQKYESTPSFKNVGETTTVYFKATAEGYDDATGSATVKISYLDYEEALLIKGVEGTDNWYTADTSYYKFVAMLASCNKNALQILLADGTTWTDWTKNGAIYGKDSIGTTNGEYTISYRIKNSDNYVTDVYKKTYKVDLDKPVVSIVYGTNPVNKVLNTLTFGQFFKDTVSVKVSATDALSGVNEFYYLKSEADHVLSADELASANWTKVEGTETTFSIPANFKGTVYVKAVDKATNTTIEYSDGTVVYKLAGAVTESVTYTKATTSNVEVVVKNNGNDVLSVVAVKDNAETPVSYTASYNQAKENATLSLDAASLDRLSAGDYTLVINYNVLGETPSDIANVSEVALKVVKNNGAGSVSMNDWTYLQSVTPVPQSNSETNTGNVTYFVKASNAEEFAKVEKNNSLDKLLPGTYTLRAVFDENDSYNQCYADTTFTVETQNVMLFLAIPNAKGTGVVYETPCQNFASTSRFSFMGLKLAENFYTSDDFAKLAGVIKKENNGVYGDVAKAFAKYVTFPETVSADAIAVKVVDSDHDNSHGKETIHIDYVVKNEPSITFADSWTYGDATPTLTITQSATAKYGVKQKETVLYTGTALDGTEYSSNVAPTKAGNYKVTVTLEAIKGFYPETKAEKEFSILPRVAELSFAISGTKEGEPFKQDGLDSVVYDGREHKILFTVTNAVEGDSLYVNHYQSGHTSVGQYTATALRISNSEKVNGAFVTNYNYVLPKAPATQYKWQIIAKDISETAEITVENVIYNGVEQTPSVVVKDGNTVLSATGDKPDYSVAYSNNVNAGTGTVTVTFSNNYTGEKKASFTINPYDVNAEYSTVSAGDIEALVYNGEAKTPVTDVTFVNGNGETVEVTTEDGFAYSYSNNVNATEGRTPATTAVATLTFNTNFTGSINKNFEILKAEGALSLTRDDSTFAKFKKNVYKLIFGNNVGIYDVTTNTSNGDITWVIDDEAIVSVSESNGKISLTPLTKEGTANITFTSTDNANGNYNPATCSISVIVVNGEIAVDAKDFHDTYDAKGHSISVTPTKKTKNLDGNEIVISYLDVTGVKDLKKVDFDSEDFTTTNPEFTNAGTYKVAYKVECEGYKTVTGIKEVKIDKREVKVEWPKTTSFTYDKTEHSVLAKLKNVVKGDEVVATYKNDAKKGETEKATNAGSYTSVVNGLSGAQAANYYVSGKPSKNWSIAKKTLKVNWSTPVRFTYDGELHSVTATFEGVCEGDVVTPVYETRANHRGQAYAYQATNAGEYHSYIKELSNANYRIEEKQREKDWQIDQREVTLAWSGVDKDGHTAADYKFTYSELSYKMTAELGNVVEGDKVSVSEYHDNDHKSVGNYNAQAVKLSNANYKLPSKASQKWSISYLVAGPAVKTGTEGKDGWFRSNVTISLDGYQIKDMGASKPVWTDSIVKTGENAKGKVEYRLKNADGYVTNTLKIDYKIDKTKPTATVEINKDSVLTNVIKWFYKDSAVVTVKADDGKKLSGVDTISYKLYDENTNTFGELISYNKATGIVINPSQLTKVFVVVTDKAGNEQTYTSDSIIVYTDAAQDTASADYVRTTEDDVTVSVILNENTIKAVKNVTSDHVLSAEEYTVSGSDIILSGEYLNTLAARKDASENDATYSFSVSYNPSGETYDAAVFGKKHKLVSGDSVGADAADTTFAIVVKKVAEDEIEIRDLSKTYDAVAVDVSANSTNRNNADNADDFTVEYRKVSKSVSDNEVLVEYGDWTTEAPVNAGDYQVKVTVSEDADYYESSAIADFTIAKKAATITINDERKPDGESDPRFTAVVTGTIPGETLSYTLVRRPGEATGVSYTIYAILGDNPNYDITVINASFIITELPAEVPPVTPVVPTVVPPTTPVVRRVTPTPAAEEVEEVAEVVTETPANVAEEVTINDEDTARADGDGNADVEIIDEPVPEAAANCWIHWLVLGLALVYAVYATTRAIQNKRELEDASEVSQN